MRSSELAFCKTLAIVRALALALSAGRHKRTKHVIDSPLSIFLAALQSCAKRESFCASQQQQQALDIAQLHTAKQCVASSSALFSHLQHRSHQWRRRSQPRPSSAPSRRRRRRRRSTALRLSLAGSSAATSCWSWDMARTIRPRSERADVVATIESRRDCPRTQPLPKPRDGVALVEIFLVTSRIPRHAADSPVW